jgi:ABC-2 type transport system ATP-binding protein
MAPSTPRSADVLTAPAPPSLEPDPPRQPLEADVHAPVPASGGAFAVHLRGVGARYGQAWVVRGLDFAVDRGTIFGLFGPSGSGKTTTLRLILGLLAPVEGTVEVLGTSPNRFTSQTRSRIGYLPQLFVLYPELSVAENLDLVASLYGLGWWRRRAPMRRVLELVELWEHRGKAARNLSGGMQRRLELAAALLHDPELIVVDEPTAGIDPILRARFWEHFRDLRDQGRTIVVTSQYVTEAEYCDRIAMLGQGQLVARGTPDDVRRQAMGGEVIDVVAAGLDRQTLALLSNLEGVRDAHLLTFESLQLTVDRADTAIPRIIAQLSAAGVEVRQIRELRPNFDEVFVRLMERQSGAEIA